MVNVMDSNRDTDYESKELWVADEHIDQVHIIVYSGKREKVTTKVGTANVPVLDVVATLADDASGNVTSVYTDVNLFGSVLQESMPKCKEGESKVMIGKLIKPGRAFLWDDDYNESELETAENIEAMSKKQLKKWIKEWTDAPF